MTTTPTPSRIDELARLVAEKIPALFADATDQINAAMTAAIENSQDKENGKAVLSLPISVKWALGSTAVAVSLSVSTTTKFEAVVNMEDPKQPGLPLGGDEEGAP